MSDDTRDWKVFRMSGDPHDRITTDLPPPPPWRDFARPEHRATTYRPTEHDVEMVNAALFLRRPLLVTGDPGTGKSSLIYAVARQLRIEPVLRWPITSRTTVRDGLYEYDAIGRLRDTNLKKRDETAPQETEAAALARYLTLGPLGTALLPSKTPRAVLIDEIDKGDVDLPNDLLHVLEEGHFSISEAARIKGEHAEVRLLPADKKKTGWRDGSYHPEEDERVTIRDGEVQCTTFPFVVITSNGERELPPAFLRRCLRLKLDPPKRDHLEQIVRAHFTDLGDAPLPADVAALVDRVAAESNREGKESRRIIATDQLLNAIYLIRGKDFPRDEKARAAIIEELLRELGQGA
jgi:MoxR-like ATPase